MISGGLGLSVALAGCALFRPPPTPGGDGPSPEALTEEAERLAEEGQTERALLLLRDALEIDPSFTAGFMQLGEISREVGNLNAAERAFGRAVQLEPDSFFAQLAHADVLAALGRTVNAVRAYLRAVTIEPDAPDARAGLASAYLEIDEPEQALPHARRAVELYNAPVAAKPDSAATDQAQPPGEGAPAGTDPAERRRRAAQAHASYGVALSLNDEHELAIEQYELAAELYDEPPTELFINWANSLGVLERYTEMENTLRFVITGGSPSALAHERLGFALFRQRRLDAAARHFREAVAMDPRHFPALNGLGIVILNDYVASDPPDQALRIQALNLLRRSLRIEANQQRITELVSRFDRG